MSRKPSFANLRTATMPFPTPAVTATNAAERGGEGVPAPLTIPSVRPPSRKGRKQIAGFFTPDMSLAMHMLALRQGRSLQALMAEAFNDVLRKHGESPIGD